MLVTQQVHGHTNRHAAHTTSPQTHKPTCCSHNKSTDTQTDMLFTQQVHRQTCTHAVHTTSPQTHMHTCSSHQSTETHTHTHTHTQTDTDRHAETHHNRVRDCCQGHMQFTQQPDKHVRAARYITRLFRQINAERCSVFSSLLFFSFRKHMYRHAMSHHDQEWGAVVKSMMPGELPWYIHMQCEDMPD